MRPLRLLRLWQVLGLLGVCVLIQQSLTSSPAVEMELRGGDKLLHFSAYATLMLWFGFIYLPGKAYLQIGAGLTLMGITMEILQGITVYRCFELTDLICNFLGVMAGWFFARTRLSMALIQLERALVHLKR
jgi:VanZ family protein